MPNRKFEVLRGAMSLKARRRADNTTAHLLSQQSLKDVRLARKISQQELAERIGVPQSAISKAESRSDNRLGTLRRYIEGMGGVLRIVADFGDSSYTIEQYRDK